MAANITPLGLFSQVLAPGQPYELETLAADVQLTGISFGSEISGENRASVKMTYFDRSTSNFGMGFDDSDDESSSDEEEYSEAAETDDEDDSGAVDEEALKKAIEEKSKKRNELLAAAAAAGVSPRKLAAKGDASMDKSAVEEDNSEGESDDDDEDMFDMSQDELKEVFIGNLLPGRIEQANINVFLAQGDTYEFQVTGENPVYLTGHYCETPRSQVNNGPDYGSDYGSEFDESDLSESESGIYDPETGLPYPDMEEDTDGERFEEIEAPAVPAKKSKAEKKAKTVPAAAVEDLSMDMDDSAKAAPSISAVDANTEGLSKNQKKKLKKQQALAAAGGAKPEISSLEGKKTEAVSVNGEGKKTVSTSTEATVTADDTKAKAKKASKKTTLPSGLVLEDVKAGAGAAAKKGQKVSMRYIGKLQNGNIFDSNTKGKPFEFKLGAGQVIKGWDEGIAGMQPGGERRLTIPAKLAYGKSGTQGIPGNATLTFEVKLLSIK